MINVIGTAILSFLIALLVAATTQNLVLSRALGVGRLISLLNNLTGTVVFSVMLTISMTLSGIFYFLCNRYLLPLLPDAGSLLRPLGLVLCMGLAFIIIFILSVKFAPYHLISEVVSALPLATFNCTVAGTLIIITKATRAYTLMDAIGFCVGAGIGFLLAVLLVTEGQRRLQSRSIPAAFRGLPAILLFLGGLAMAIYGLVGYQFIF